MKFYLLGNGGLGSFKSGHFGYDVLRKRLLAVTSYTRFMQYFKFYLLWLFMKEAINNVFNVLQNFF